jgi:hypothetical protein
MSDNAIPDSDPLSLFEAWFAEACASEPNDPHGMALATATPDAVPSVRMVLLKGHDERGFVFYTNARSRKGGEILANPQAALLFHWKSLRRQVRIEGPLTEVAAEEADAYFHSRPFVSQLGSAASGRAFKVSLTRCDCSCGMPSLLHLPCSHLYTAARVRNVDVNHPLTVRESEFSIMTVKTYPLFHTAPIPPAT